MADVKDDHPALGRLDRLRPTRPPTSAPSSAAPALPKMGYQPTLDGLRGVSVMAVLLYHAGFHWMHGGFFGVEVFFVVSGFLITSLLIEERDGTGRIHLWQFWVRRWRRLLPAFFAMLVVVGIWTVFWGTAEQQNQVRQGYPWGILYLANWGQIFSGTPYFAGMPSMFRHLWSLAVEEQWYLIWPLVFVGIARHKRDDAKVGRAIVGVAAAVMVITAVMSLLDKPTQWPFFFSLHPSEWGMRPVDTTNFLYLSTFTRSSGLLLGAGLAFLYRPWRVTARPKGSATRTLDRVAAVACLALVVSFVTGRVAGEATYLWMLPLVTIASAALIAVVVHPWASTPRVVFGWRPLVEVGKRSYGLYLWSWPIQRIVGAYVGSYWRFALAMAITIPVTEVSYRYIETPIRRGGLGRWWKDRNRHDWGIITACAVVSTLAIGLSMAVYYGSAPAVYDAARDTSGEEVAFDADAALAGSTGSTATGSTGAAEVAVADTSAGSTIATTAPPPVTAATLPRRVVIVGDSTAHSLAINLPDGIESTFAVSDGSVEGCSVYSDGTAVSSYEGGFTRSFDGCAGWEQKWQSAAQVSDAEVALVVIGAWDVFDVKAGGQTVAFGTAAGDQRFLAGVQQGIDALASTGAKVALLEVPCMRPQQVKGAGVPPLPERGDDQRVAHVNDLLRQAAAANPATTVFVTGPAEYCTEPIASDLAYRWDGVHAYKPGAKLTFEAIANSLLTIPVP